MSGNVIPLRGKSVPRVRGIRVYVDALKRPTVRHPVTDCPGMRVDTYHRSIEAARAFAAALATKHGWAVTDEAGGGGRAA